MGVTMRRGDCHALMTGDGAADAVIECFECKGVMYSGIWEPRGDRGSGILKPYFIFVIADVIGRFRNRLSKRAKVQDAVDWSDKAIGISMLSEAVLGHVVVRDGQGVIVQT